MMHWCAPPSRSRKIRALWLPSSRGYLQLAPARPVLRQEEIVREGRGVARRPCPSLSRRRTPRCPLTLRRSWPKRCSQALAAQRLRGGRTGGSQRGACDRPGGCEARRGRLPAGGLRHDPSAFAWNTCAHLHPGAGETLLLWLLVPAGHDLAVRQRGRQRLRGTGTFLGTPSQGSLERLDFLVPPGGIAKLHSEPSAVCPRPGRRARWTCTACRSGPAPLMETRSPNGPAGRTRWPHARPL